MLTASVRVQHNSFAAAAAAVRPKIDAIQRKVCADIVAGAVSRTQRVDTGAMKGGYRWERVGDQEYIVYNLMHYFIHHELGTTTISAMPMLVPSLEAQRVAYSRAITAALARGA